MKRLNIKHLTTIVGAFALMFVVSFAEAQIDYEIGRKNMTLVDSSRAFRNINLTVFYPADNGGPNAPMAAPSNKKFPLVVFGHAEKIPVHYYQYIKDFYVPRGFMVAFPKTELSNNPNHLDFAMDMVYIIEAFEKMKTDPASFFYGRYNMKSCVSGHGMGGGAAILAAEMKQDISVLFTIAATETTPSAVAAAQNVTIPSLVFIGGKDCIAPSVINSEPMFNSLASACKVFINQVEGTHCQFAEDNKKCTKDETGCPVSAYPADSTNEYTNRLSVSFLRYYMKYNALAWPLFIDKMTTYPDVVYVNSCFVPGTPRLADDQNEVKEDGYIRKFNLYPNPSASNDNLKIELESFERISATVTIVNTLGQQVYLRNFTLDAANNNIIVPTSGFAPGNYIVTVTDGVSQRITKPLIIQ